MPCGVSTVACLAGGLIGMHTSQILVSLITDGGMRSESGNPRRQPLHGSTVTEKKRLRRNQH